MESPCLTPLLQLKNHIILPLAGIDNLVECKISLIQSQKVTLNSDISRAFRIKYQPRYWRHVWYISSLTHCPNTFYPTQLLLMMLLLQKKLIWQPWINHFWFEEMILTTIPLTYQPKFWWLFFNKKFTSVVGL